MSSTTAPKKSHVSLIVVTSLMLFSMFFGAGNLIFPPQLGVDAGTNFWPAIIGFLGAGVLLPVLGIIAIALSGDSVRDLASRAGRVFGLIFPILAYLSIGAFYALPRTGAVSFEMAVTPLTGWDSMLASGIFNFIFFGVALALSWNPNTISSTLGKYLTPVLVVLLALLIILALVNFDYAAGAPNEVYTDAPMAAGLIEGYLTMDAIAALAFGIVVISSLRYNGVKEGKPLATAAIVAGLGAGVLLGAIYVGLGLIGQVIPDGGSYDNGALILASAANITMGTPGQVIFAAIVVLACLTTAVGLVTATSEFFNELLPGISYKTWAVIFAFASFAMATAGLDTVLSIAAPVIGFIYPPAIALIFIALIEPIFGRGRFRWTYLLGVWVAVIWSALTSFGVTALVDWAPLQDAGLGWVLPTVVAVVIGLVIDLATRRGQPTPQPAEEQPRVLSES